MSKKSVNNKQTNKLNNKQTRGYTAIIDRQGRLRHDKEGNTMTKRENAIFVCDIFKNNRQC